jgi:hypothetical protein
MVVGRDTLYLYGGMMEVGDREVTLDDLYTLDLNKLDAWNLVIEASPSSVRKLPKLMKRSATSEILGVAKLIRLLLLSGC